MAVKNSQKAIEAEEAEKATDNAGVEEKAKEMAKNKGTEEKETLIYIGPSLPAWRLKNNQIFVGSRQEIEKELEGVLKKYPFAGRLLIPVGQLAEKKEKVRTYGNILNKYYSDIASSEAEKGRMG